MGISSTTAHPFRQAVGARSSASSIASLLLFCQFFLHPYQIPLQSGYNGPMPLNLFTLAPPIPSTLFYGRVTGFRHPWRITNIHGSYGNCKPQYQELFLYIVEKLINP
jgi:hypothetical protein